jgi:CHAD domain-containing protein
VTAMPTSMRAYAMVQLSGLLENTITELHNTARKRNAEAIHKVRVSIRRLLQALKTFAQYVPEKARHQVHEELRGVLKAAGDVRDCDVLLEMLEDSGVALGPFRKQRTAMKQELLAKIHPLLPPDVSKRWRDELGISTP